jgi:cytochrome c553
MRRKLEIQNSKFEASSKSQIRISEFGFVSNFECRVSNFFFRFALILLLVLTSSCRRDMFNQPSSKPLSRNDFFQDNQMASRPVVMHTIARGRLEEDEAFYTGKIGTNLVTTFPMPVTREVLERGRERFDIYCSVCHGRTGEGNGIIVQRGFPVPPSYHIDRLRQAPVGHFFDVMTQGYGIMYSYAERVKPEDRWAIAAYIRALQLSHNMKLAELPADERARLEGSK